MRVRSHRVARFLLAATVAVAAAGCGSDEKGSSATAAPAATTAAAVTSAPAETTAASTADSTADSTGASTATVAGTDGSAPAPTMSANPVEFTFAMGSPGLLKSLILETLDRVETTTGHKGEFVELADSDLVVQGAAEGQFDMGSSTTSAVMNVIQGGAKLVFVAESSRNQWTLMSKKEITGCADLNGVRLGLHSPGGVSTALYRAWYKRNCNGETPTELFIEGSPNRLQALLGDQIDVAMIELEDTLQLPEDQYTLLANFTEDLKDIKTGLVYSNTDFAKEHRDVVQAFVTEFVHLQQEINADPQVFKDIIEQRMPGEVTDVDQVVDAYIKAGIIPDDGGMTMEDLQSSIAFYQEAGVLEPGLTPEAIADRSFLEAALGK